MSTDPSPWRALAEAEVARTIEALPKALRQKARELPVTCEVYPSAELESEGVASDTLGLFVGEPWAEAGSTASPLPGQIILFLENLKDYTEGDPEAFGEEVRTTYLHELGHYLGLDEDELSVRGLE